MDKVHSSAPHIKTKHKHYNVKMILDFQVSQSTLCRRFKTRLAIIKSSTLFLRIFCNQVRMSTAWYMEQKKQEIQK